MSPVNVADLALVTQAVTKEEPYTTYLVKLKIVSKKTKGAFFDAPLFL